jgi:hypothetical protein
MRIALGYVRVSTDEQAERGLGLEAQRQRVRAYCEMKGLHLTTIFEDPGLRCHWETVSPNTRNVGETCYSVQICSLPEPLLVAFEEVENLPMNAGAPPAFTTM